VNLEDASHPEHTGDMPVLLVNSDGTGEAGFKTDRFALKNLFDEDGSAIIVHALPDNYANIPERYGAADQATLATGTRATGSLAVPSRSAVRKRTTAGLTAARVRGRIGGRPKALTPKQRRIAQSLYDDPQNSIAEICRTLKISKAMLYRYIKPWGREQ
jgi:hypothetical protein